MSEQMVDLLHLDYLKAGNKTQKKIYNVLKDCLIFERLKLYTPILVGTFPLAIDVPGSDIDIVCAYKSKAEFISLLTDVFGQEDDFKLNNFFSYGYEAVTLNFKKSGFEFEIFGQNIPVKEQMGYRHMIIEQKLLFVHGEVLRDAIIELKLAGYKTEPAFCKWLGIDGNPFLELLKLEN